MEDEEFTGFKAKIQADVAERFDAIDRELAIAEAKQELFNAGMEIATFILAGVAIALGLYFFGST